MKKIYEIQETIRTVDGEQRFSIVYKCDEILGCPVYMQVFTGTKEECVNKLIELEKENK